MSSLRQVLKISGTNSTQEDLNIKFHNGFNGLKTELKKW